ncbi:hypothetical protein D5400_16875 [Georhizobium profundi]|uniref:Uncharacterized protein n=1 Tax=Georhizobium profundi TaxID=2341112 RepID=A0A3S9B755_9HYPH|nr:hypothetical protein [Georhizobium profundi]AZN72724.1 hypothetical protein D5400_16875 [Georhizobium profundi]
MNDHVTDLNKVRAALVLERRRLASEYDAALDPSDSKVIARLVRVQEILRVVDEAIAEEYGIKTDSSYTLENV